MITARRMAVISVLLLLAFIYATADPAPACMPRRQVVPVPFEHVPSILLQSLKERLGEIAAPGASFNATDTFWFENVPNRRFIFFWTAGRLWVVAAEQGGFAYNNPIFLYDLGDDEGKADLIAEKVAFPSTACVVASNLIAAP